MSAKDTPRTTTELDPRHEVIVFPVKPDEDQTEEAAA